MRTEWASKRARLERNHDTMVTTPTETDAETDAETDSPNGFFNKEWIGDAEDCEEIEQFARDYDWGDTPEIEDPEDAAGQILSELDADRNFAQEARAKLRAALWTSAERENERREAARA